MTVDIPTVELAHGAHLPVIGLGTSPMGDAELDAVLPAALEAGYRLFDTAENYRNEVAVGRALAESGVPRADLFVTTKFNKQWHRRDLVEQALDESLERLGLEYVDCFMIHWPNPAEDRYVEAYEGLVALLEAGRIRAIGLSNFKPAHIERLLEATGVAPDIDQLQCNPLVARRDARAFNATNGIVTESWSPLGGDGAKVLAEPVVDTIAAAHGATPAQVVLAWHVAQGLVAIPKSASPTRVVENVGALELELEPEEIAALSGLDRGEDAALDSDRFGH